MKRGCMRSPSPGGTVLKRDLWRRRKNGLIISELWMSSGLVGYRGEMLIRLVLAFAEIGVIRS